MSTLKKHIPCEERGGIEIEQNDKIHIDSKLKMI